MSNLNRKSRRGGRLLAGALASVLAIGLLPGMALADHGVPRTTDEACPEGTAPDAFNDDEASTFEDEINCIAAFGITTGTTATTYSPGLQVSREQMPSFIMRKLDEVNGYARPTNPPDAFPDDEASVHEANINDAAAENIARGYSDGTFRPGDSVTRGEMASFLVRQLETAGATLPDNPPDAFDDDTGSAHEENLNILFALDIYVGRTDGSSGFADAINREQMAGLLARDVAYLVEQGLIDALEEPAPATVTSAPELVSAEIIDVDTAGTDAGTTIRYTFDEAVEEADDSTLFHAYETDGTVYDGADADLDTNDDNSVLVFFSDAALQTQAGADQLSVATVDFSAVQDVDNEDNPIGDAPLNDDQGGDTTLPAGITSAPDLTAVDVQSEINTEGVFETLFTFDEIVRAVSNRAGFHLVLEDGTQIECIAVEVEPGDTTVEAECGDDAAGTDPDFVAADVSRGFVDAMTVSDDPDDADPDAPPAVDTGAVGTDTGNTNPLQAAEAEGDDGNTEIPDLVSAQFFPSSGTGDDRVAYTFDEPVNINTCTDFAVYDTNGDETFAAAAECTKDSARVIVVDFPNETLEDMVGASVEDGAVIEDSVDARPNEEDEVGVQNTAQAVGSGFTSGPDLIEVNVTEETSVTGTVTGVLGTFIFDEDVETLAAAADEGPGELDFEFFLTAADGTRYTATDCEAVDLQDDPGVECSEWQEIDENGDVVDATPDDEDVLEAVLGTVDNDQVTDDDGLGNPEGAEIVTA